MFCLTPTDQRHVYMTDLISDCKLAACVNIRVCGCLPLCVRSVMDWGYIWDLYRCLFKFFFFYPFCQLAYAQQGQMGTVCEQLSKSYSAVSTELECP